MDERVIVWSEYGATHIHPLALGFTLAMGLLLLVIRRSQAVLPLALVATLIPVAQRVVVASLDFNMIRILILFGWARIVLRGELRPLRWNAIDAAVLAWVSLGTLMHVAGAGSLSTFVYRLGVSFDVLGTYFLFRMLLRRPGDALRASHHLAWCATVVAAGIAIEWSTARNLFALFGGVPEITLLREGRLRCQGAFSHPIMAGSFGAGLLPIFVGLGLATRRGRPVAALGAAAAIVITLASSSSGPALALSAAIGAWGLWGFRAHLGLLRWGAVGVLLFLHFAREKPVWHLIGRASDLIGGTGYHRYLLIDAFIHRWREWIAFGTPSTAHWGWGLQDVTNQFVYEGVTGGILTLAAFVALVALSFRAIGRCMDRRAAMRTGRPSSRQALWLWGLGASLAAHCTSFISVSYFGQMSVILILLIAVISAECSFALPRRTRPRPRDSEPASDPVAAPAPMGLHPQAR